VPSAVAPSPSSCRPSVSGFDFRPDRTVAYTSDSTGILLEVRRGSSGTMP